MTPPTWEGGGGDRQSGEPVTGRRNNRRARSSAKEGSERFRCASYGTGLSETQRVVDTREWVSEKNLHRPDARVSGLGQTPAAPPRRTKREAVQDRRETRATESRAILPNPGTDTLRSGLLNPGVPFGGGGLGGHRYVASGGHGSYGSTIRPPPRLKKTRA